MRRLELPSSKPDWRQARRKLSPMPLFQAKLKSGYAKAMQCLHGMMILSSTISAQQFFFAPTFPM
jgi:hypothetical protein